MKCIIIEDQPPAQRILKKFIADMGSLELEGTFSDAIQALEFLQTEKVDLIFLDIHLPKISGIDFLKTLQHPPQVILTTAFADYALESYDLDVTDYLLKPFSFQRFVKAVSKAMARTPGFEAAGTSGNSGPQSLFIKSGHSHIKLEVEDILFINSDGDYTEIHIPAKKFLSSESLRHWEETLDIQQFVRVHKSYIVHIPKIEQVRGGRIFLTDGRSIPIGRAYKEDFSRRFL